MTVWVGLLAGPRLCYVLSFGEDLQHTLWLLTLHGELGLSPKIKEPAKRVMDVGTGTGIWAIEYGTPSSPFTDLCADHLIQPIFIPKLRYHCSFPRQDYLTDWFRSLA